MNLADDTRDEVDEAVDGMKEMADDAENKFYEEKGKMEERMDDDDEDEDDD